MSVLPPSFNTVLVLAQVMLEPCTIQTARSRWDLKLHHDCNHVGVRGVCGACS